jgi:hypothetical protein
MCFLGGNWHAEAGFLRSLKIHGFGPEECGERPNWAKTRGRSRANGAGAGPRGEKS